jgi:hypothetical protein
MERPDTLDRRIEDLADFLDPVAFEHGQDLSLAKRRKAAWREGNQPDYLLPDFNLVVGYASLPVQKPQEILTICSESLEFSKERSAFIGQAANQNSGFRIVSLLKGICHFS